MWGFGGRFYWGRRNQDETRGNTKGIVVVFAWMSSQDSHLKNYIQLYSSIGWDSLVCHSQFLNLFFPDKAASLASDILTELIKELKDRPCPIVFASFSGGPKACMYKVIQIIDGTCKTHINPDDLQLVKDCVSGHIYDSTPADFTSDLGTRFVLHPTILKTSRPPIIATWIANGISSSLDAFFLTKWELQRADYWQTLYSTVAMGAPYLVLCSENDELAPYQIIRNFVERLESLGGDVKLVKWSNSPHVGHYRHHPEEYKAAVTELLTKAASVYSTRVEQQLKTSEPLDHLQEPLVSGSNHYQNSKRMALDSNQRLIVPRTMVHDQVRETGSVQDEEHFIRQSVMAKMNGDGIDCEILFDVCVKNVEDWDLRSFGRHSDFSSIKCIRRSKI